MKTQDRFGNIKLTNAAFNNWSQSINEKLP